MGARLKRHEELLIRAVRDLGAGGGRVTAVKDRRGNWRLGGPDGPAWADRTLDELAGRGYLLLDRDEQDERVQIELGKQLTDLTPVQQKLLDRIGRRMAQSGEPNVICRSGAHRMRYIGTDVLGAKEETYRQLEEKGFIEVEYMGSGSTGAWLVEPTARART